MKKLTILALIAVLVPMIGAAAQTFTGTEAITNDANWGGTAPTFGGTINDRLNFNGTTTYTADQGTTSISNSGDRGLVIGNGNGTDGDLTVSGGTLIVDATKASLIGAPSKTGTAQAALTLSGGNMVFSNEISVASRGATGSSSTVTVNNGSTLTADITSYGALNAGTPTGIINVNSGGTLETRTILTRDSTMTANLNVDGGTLKAIGSGEERLVRGKVNFTIGASGATIDTSGIVEGIEVAVNGSGMLTLTGGGGMLLEQDSSFFGNTSVGAGLLLAGRGSISNSVVTLNNGLIGAGGKNNWNNTAGEVQTDSLIGELGVGSVDGTGTMAIEYDADDAQVFDLLTVVGDLDIANIALDLTDVGTNTLVGSSTYTIATFGSLTGSDFSSVSGLQSGWSYSVNANDITVTIPEPATIGLIGAFGAAILFIRRRFMI